MTASVENDMKLKDQSRNIFLCHAHHQIAGTLISIIMYRLQNPSIRYHIEATTRKGGAIVSKKNNDKENAEDIKKYEALHKYGKK